MALGLGNIFGMAHSTLSTSVINVLLHESLKIGLTYPSVAISAYPVGNQLAITD